jgi:hypothetical protein
MEGGENESFTTEGSRSLAATFYNDRKKICASVPVNDGQAQRIATPYLSRYGHCADIERHKQT